MNNIIETFYVNGMIMSSSSVNEQLEKDGLYQLWDEDGNLIAKGIYYNGIRIGDWDFYNDNHHTIETYDDNGHIINQTEYYDNGNIKSSGTYEEEYPSNVWTYYNDDGTIRDEGEYKNREIWDGYFEAISGDNSYYYHGLKQGMNETYDENGWLLGKGKYNKNIKTGFWLERALNTYNYDIGDYYNGYKTGKWFTVDSTTEQILGETEYK